MSKGDKKEINEQIAASIKNFSTRAKDETTRQRIIIEMPEFIQQKAALISAHFLLPAGARLLDMGCETGEITYMLAHLNPRVEVIGVDRDEAAIDFARKTYKLPNLSYRVTDISIPDFEDESVDAILNSNILHGVYSTGGYNPEEVSQLLEQQIHKLKPGGTMLIRDYMMPPEGDFVLLELPSTPSEGKTPDKLSDADLLILFSQSARPLPAGGCEGFFIEEKPPRRAGTRLFRLPHKWALEFVHRKNYRTNWKKETKEEYTFFTYQDYRREFARIGMRMVFSSPHWNEWVVKNCFKGFFQLYSEDYKPMNHPATNYFIVAQKVADKQSLVLEERRPSTKPVGDLQIIAVRDKKTGQLHELVKRPGEYCDIVPYRITADNRLVIYVRSGYPRPIVNAVSRGSHNLDGKKWSGHLIEPITMETVSMTDEADANRRMIFDYVEDYANLRPKSEDGWYVGQTYFPSPDRIDEAIEPVFVEVENPYKTSWPLKSDKDIAFTEKGYITELDATGILLASQVGLLPEPRLELHAFDLMLKHKMQMPRWIGEKMPITERHHVKPAEFDTLLKGHDKPEFEEEKRGAATQLKPVKAVFVEEGKVGRQTRGLSAQDIEFIVTEDGIENIAVVMPITRDWDNNLLVSLEPKILPVPNRLGGDQPILNAPSFTLPKDVKTIEDAKAFVASKFSVKVDQVSQLGESYFTHVGVTPQRVYPFTVASALAADGNRVLQYMLTHRLVDMARAHRFLSFSGSALKLLARTHIRLDIGSHGMSMQRDDTTQKYQSFSLSTDKVAIEAVHSGYSAVPSRILGQRGPVDPVVETEADAPDTGKSSQPISVSWSYAAANSEMEVTKTKSMEEIDASIGEVARSLFRKKGSGDASAPGANAGSGKRSSRGGGGGGRSK